MYLGFHFVESYFITLVVGLKNVYDLLNQMGNSQFFICIYKEGFFFISIHLDSFS